MPPPSTSPLSPINIKCEGCQSISSSTTTNNNKPRLLQCPTCIKLKLDPSFFCSQKCFRDNWAVHKKKHVAHSSNHHHHGVDNIEGNPWPGFKYSGELRACYPLSARRLVPDHITKPDYAADGQPKSELRLARSAHLRNFIRAYTDPDQVLRLRRACALARLVLDSAARLVRPGVCTDQIDRVVHDTTILYNAYPSPLNYFNFPKSCCTSVNEVICHGIPDQRKLKNGDLVNIDVTVYLDGFHGDMNKTYLVVDGDVNDISDVSDYADSIKLIDCARECLDKAIDYVKVGRKYREFGKVIEKHAESSGGFSVVRTYCGHGIGELFHCAPNIPHYSNNKAVGSVKVGHAFTIEPMLNQGSWRDMHWPDNWTACTVDGKRSAQFEHTLWVNEQGQVEVLTRKDVYLEYFGKLPDLAPNGVELAATATATAVDPTSKVHHLGKSDT